LICQKQQPHVNATPVNPADLSVQPSNQPKPATSRPRELDAEPTAPEQVHTWLRLDPSLTAAVLAKTEEELLGGLAALMRNKVETENAVRRLAQILTETGQAQKELERVREQVRQAEDELAARMDEHQRIKEQVLESQALLRVRQEQVTEYREMWTSLQADAERVRRELAQLHTQVRTAQPDPAAIAGMEQRLAQVRTEVDSAMREKEGLEAELRRLGEQRSQLSGDVANLQREVEERRAALETLKREMQRLNERQDRLQPDPGQDQGQSTRSIPSVSASFVQGASALETLKDRTVLESYAAQLRDAEAVATRADEKSIGLPLWFGQPLPPVAKGFDPYRLESEFFSDEPLDARVVTGLVAKLPGLDGCLVVQNRGPVLASRLAEHYYEQLRVPDRDYSLLFGRLPNRRDDLRMPEGRVAIYQLENGFLTVTQADHIFMITTSGQPRLKPGMPHKLVTIARELAKMYSPQAYGVTGNG
jgi:uncharacterized coiled-coil DUF342 family protein